MLATDRVRYVGEPVALVLAETRSAAEDAAELVWVDYEETAAVSSLDDALAAGAQPVHPEAPGNLLLDLFMFQEPALEDIFTRAAVVVDGVFDSGRVTAAPMEGRGVVAEWDRREGRLTLHMSTQVPHIVRTAVADTLGLAENLVRVVAPDVGGGFGQKCAVGREEIAVAAAAALTRRPVKWVEDRRENLLAAFQGHEQRHRVRAGFDAEGTILGLSTDIWCDVGAYHCYPFTGGVEPLMAATEMPGPYRLQHYSARTRAVASNKPPMAPYRGVSRPQITLAMERIMDKAAVRLGLDPAEIRRRNLIRRDEFPYRGATGILYDEGSYLEALEGVVAAAGYESLRRNTVPPTLRPATARLSSGSVCLCSPRHRLRDTGVRPAAHGHHPGVRDRPRPHRPLWGGHRPRRDGLTWSGARHDPCPDGRRPVAADPDPGPGGPRGHRRRPLRLGNLRQQVGGAVG